MRWLKSLPVWVDVVAVAAIVVVFSKIIGNG